MNYDHALMQLCFSAGNQAVADAVLEKEYVPKTSELAS